MPKPHGRRGATPPAPTSPAKIARRGGRRDAAVEHCVALLQASEGRVPLAALVAGSGLGERQLQRRFAQPSASRRARSAA
jgi:hypothetical protein